MIVNRFSGVRIEDLQGELLNLCKDQHGCRYLQKKLEEGDSAHRDLIFHETYGHFPELMTDPFGNYLCQKLLEYSTEEQRSAIIESVSSELVGISLNMHGTRAVQKMVDFLASPRQQKQIRTLIYALSVNVVALIKDLNGNHVGQVNPSKWTNADGFALGHPEMSEQVDSRGQPIHLQRDRRQPDRSRNPPTRLLRASAIDRPRQPRSASSAGH